MIRVLTAENNEEWDAIVRSFPAYDVYYLSGYAKALSNHGEGEPLLILYEDGCTRAVNVVMRRDIAEEPCFSGKLTAGTWYDLSTPYGYGGFLTEGSHPEKAEGEYVQYCHDCGYVSEFVRFHLFGKYQDIFCGTVEKTAHNVVRSLELPLDAMWMDFEHKVRKNIKRAVSSGLTLEIDASGKRLEEFLDIYYKTMDRNQAKEKYYFKESFFKDIQCLKGHFCYFHVLREGKVISTELVLYGKENSYSFLGGTDREFYELRPNDFLKYEIIKWSKEMGLKRFVLGGGYGENDTIFRYKKSFAPEGIYQFYTGRRILDGDRYHKLAELKKAEGMPADTGFFPEYRG